MADFETLAVAEANNGARLELNRVLEVLIISTSTHHGAYVQEFVCKREHAEALKAGIDKYLEATRPQKEGEES